MAAVWKSDTAMETLLGDWWTQEMELHPEASMADNVAQANAEFAERGIAMRVLNCAEDDDECLWQVELETA